MSPGIKAVIPKVGDASPRGAHSNCKGEGRVKEMNDSIK